MKRSLILGVIFIVASYLISFFYQGINNFIHPLGTYSLFMLGCIKIFDFITLKIYKKSLISSLFKSKKNILSFVAISFVGGIILELIAKYSGKLWIYPSWGWTFYILTFVPGFAFYWLVICESYLASKSVIDYSRKGKKYVTKSFRWEDKFFKVLGILGSIILILTLSFVYFDYSNNPSSIFIQKEDISQKTNSYILPFYFIIGFFFGLWFILEYFQYNKKKASLIKDILHNHFSPLLAIVLGSFILAVIMESQNLLYDMWIYINWPLEQITFIGLPVVMFLTWPLHYILFLSLWRAFTDEQSEEVWKGDIVK